MKKILILASFALLILIAFSSCAVYTADDYCSGSYYHTHYYHRPAPAPVYHRPSPVHHSPRPTVHHHSQPSKPSPRPSVQSKPHQPKPAPNPRTRSSYDYNHHRNQSRK